MPLHELYTADRALRHVFIGRLMIAGRFMIKPITKPLPKPNLTVQSRHGWVFQIKYFIEPYHILARALNRYHIENIRLM